MSSQKTKLFYFFVFTALPLAAQIPAAEQAFINSVTTSVTNLTAGLPNGTPIVFGGNLVFADGLVVSKAPLSVLLGYVDGLKAAGVQRIDLNPGATSINDPVLAANYLAVVQHARQLGLQIAINPEIDPGSIQPPTFAQFEATAMQTYPQLAKLLQPDNFVIVHEPTTAQGALGIGSPQDWSGFITAVAPLIKQASPHTRLGAGGFQNGALTNLSAQENTYWTQFVTLPVLDFMTMDIYNDDTFSTYDTWISLAKTNHKGIYIEETWAPHYLPVPLPASMFSPIGNLTKSLDQVALVGAGSSDFVQMDATWLQGMAKWASANGMEAMTAFTTQAFFASGTPGTDCADGCGHIFSPNFSAAVQSALGAGQLTSTGQAFQTYVAQMGIPEAASVSSASYAKLPTAFTPDGNANSTIAPDELVSLFGADVANATGAATSTSFPSSLAGTTMTLVDSSNTTFNVPLYYVSPKQINYLVPSNVQPGPGTLTIHSGDGAVTSGIVLIQSVQPGLYTANQQGSGAPAALAICTGTCAGWTMSNGQFQQYATGPISIGSGDTVTLELYGTGIRHLAAISDVSVQINGQNATIAFAGAQGQYTGLDQINVTLTPSMAGSAVPLVVNILDPTDNISLTSNTVMLNIQ